MKLLVPVYLLLLSLLSPFAYSQSEKEIGHLEFTDTLFNFGSVDEAQGVLSHSFPFVNLGPEYFFIEEIDPSCGCITPEYPTDTIHAGEQGKIVLYFDPVNHPGLFERKVAIKGNASKAPVYLYITGYVSPSPQPVAEWERTSSFKYNTVYIQKNYANFGAITTKDLIQMEIPVYNGGSNTISMNVDKLKLPAYVKASVLPLKIEAKEKGMIKIQFNPKLANKYGHFAEQIELIFQSSGKPIEVPIVLSAFVKEYFNPAEPSMNSGKISLDKNDVDLGIIKTDDTTQAQINVVNIGMSDLVIKSIRTSCSCVEVFAEKMILKPGASTKVSIFFDTTERLGMETKLITIFTNDPVNPIATVKIRGQVVGSMVAVPGQ